jgi:putative ABC transport system permease protein
MMLPPHLADRLLKLFCAPHLREEVLGDLHERYVLRVQEWGEANARRRYWREVLAYIRPSMMKRQQSEYPNPTNYRHATELFQNRVSNPYPEQTVYRT